MRVGNDKVRRLNHLRLPEENIDIQGPRSLWKIPNPARVDLNFQTECKESGGIQIRGDFDNSVQKPGLIWNIAWLGPIQRGAAKKSQVSISEGADGRAQMHLPVSQVGAQAQINAHDKDYAAIG